MNQPLWVCTGHQITLHGHSTSLRWAPSAAFSFCFRPCFVGAAFWHPRATPYSPSATRSWLLFPSHRLHPRGSSPACSFLPGFKAKQSKKKKKRQEGGWVKGPTSGGSQQQAAWDFWGCFAGTEGPGLRAEAETDRRGDFPFLAGENSVNC